MLIYLFKNIIEHKKYQVKFPRKRCKIFKNKKYMLYKNYCPFYNCKLILTIRKMFVKFSSKLEKRIEKVGCSCLHGVRL